MRKTKIICTLGPACDDYEVLKQLALSGMNCARLNFSHGTHEQQLVRINRVKKLRDEMGIALPILLDTKGPEIRFKDFVNGSVEVKQGDLFTLSADPTILGDNTIGGLSFPELAKSVEPGVKILVDDGKIGLNVVRIEGKDVVCEVLNDGKISNHKSLNVPNVEIDMVYLSNNDISDIEFGCSQDVDFIAASFVRCAQDVLDVREILKRCHKEDIMIIAKIENMQGINNVDEILEVADGLMVARGDMGVEVDFDMLPAIQKDMISKCYRKGKIVVTATQMLESMTKNPRPTRAEVSDVANAVLDGADAVMLSGETTVGKYPREAVEIMARICEYTESTIDYTKHTDYKRSISVSDTIAKLSVDAVEYNNIKAIVTTTMTGYTARKISNFRPNCTILACCPTSHVAEKVALNFGVKPVITEIFESTDEIVEYAKKVAKKELNLKSKDLIVVTGGFPLGKSRTTNYIRVEEI
jgi:pyruvate kinase